MPLSTPIARHLSTHASYVASVDGWRGVAIFYLMVCNFYYFFTVRHFIPYGHLAVDTCFMVGGFLLAWHYELLIATRHIRLKTFVLRRLARFYPVYLVSLVVFVLVNEYYIRPSVNPAMAIGYGIGPEMAWRLILQLGLVGNVMGMPMPWNGPAWAIGVFWLMALLFYFITSRLFRSPSYLWVMMGSFSLLYLMDQSSTSINQVYAIPSIFNATLARGLLGFSIGFLVCRFHRRLPKLPSGIVHLLDLIMIALFGLFVVYYDESFAVGGDYVLAVVVLPLIFMQSLYRESAIGQFFALPLFVWFGRISLSIYLLHLPIGYAFQYSPTVAQLGLTRPAYGVCYLALVLAAALICHFGLVQPCRKLIERWANN